MIDYADKDRDGRISLEEFLEVVTKEYPQVWSSIIYHHFIPFCIPLVSIIIKHFQVNHQLSGNLTNPRTNLFDKVKLIK